MKHIRSSFTLVGWMMLTALVASCSGSDSGDLTPDPSHNPDASAGSGGISGSGGTGATGGEAGQQPDAGGTGGDASVEDTSVEDTSVEDTSVEDVSDDATMSCTPLGQSCTTHGECCSAFCDPLLSTCSANSQVCTAAGGPCTSNTECCSLNCAGGLCQQTGCISDGEACTAGGDACCSGICESGLCKDINGSIACRSAGNTCSDNGDCCSKLCSNGFCDLYVSHCIQLYDLCSHTNQCCSGSCKKAASSDPYGYCDPLNVGPNRCKDGAAGMVCDSCGICCSRACAPGTKGVMICQSPSGCRPQGEICRSELDCCGGDSQSGLPGSESATVTCDKTAPTDEYGRCKVQGCLPQGEVCQLIGGACSESTSLPSNCCPTNANPSNPAHKKGECEFDNLLIPRCDGLKECVPQGGYCSSSADCCEDLPCVPDPNDNNRLKCYIPDDSGSTCVPEAGMCTNDADCCSPHTCIVPPGEIFGVCGTDGTGGSGGGTGGTGGSPGDPCAAYGQACSITDDCCHTELGVTCIGGRCLIQG